MSEPDSAALSGRVLLVEDDAPTRDWLASLLALEPGLQVTGACDSVAQSLAWLRRHDADFALVDLGLPDGSGLEVIRELATHHRDCEVLVLSIFGDEANVLAAIAAGAGGYLLKDGELGSFGDHLSCLRTGGSPLSPRIARTLIQLHRPAALAAAGAAAAGTRAARIIGPVAAGQASGSLPLLSDRELEVLTGIAKGFSYGEVAASLGVSTNTVRSHIRHLYEKLSVNSRSEAVYEYNRLMRELGRSPLQ
jgi:DNA-binding NarL/FixJ family response regulator